MPLRIRSDKISAEKFKLNFVGVADRMETALKTSVNMAASMIEKAGRADIGAAGHFGARWTSGLHVSAETTMGNMRISMTHDIPYANIFETGGVIKGKPLLWIPLSFSDARGIAPKNYPGGLFSVQRPDGARPLLFSKADGKPKYFGISQVVIPKKFHLQEIQTDVMLHFRQIFNSTFKATR